MEKSLFVFCDGGSRGNPGPAAIGFLVKDSQGRILVRRGKRIGEATNNVAEYTAVIEALKWLTDHLSLITDHSPITFFLDSKLIVNQLNGLFKIKNHGLRQLIIKARQLEREIKADIFYCFIPREKNQGADFLVNKALK